MGYKDWNNDSAPAVAADHDWQAAFGDFDSIPVINVRGLRSDDLKDRISVANDIRDACARVGFFYIENHGIPQDLIDGVFRHAHKFFAQPFDKKMEIYIENSKNFRGYTPVGASGKPGPDGKGNLNEAFEWGLDEKTNDDPTHHCTDPWMAGPNRWPRDLKGFEEHLTAYYCQIRGFGRLLTRAIALSLNLPEHYFEAHVTHPGCTAVLAHYPPQKRGSAGRGLDAHTDSEFFTILATGDVPALEVLNKAGEWIAAPPKAGTFVVNVGDMLQAYSNDRYVSARHRVMNYSGQERYAIPYFFSPNYETIIKLIPALITESHIAEFSTIPAGKMYYENMSLLHGIASTIPEFSRYLTAP